MPIARVQKSVFLAHTGTDTSDLQDRLRTMLLKAGLYVLSKEDNMANRAEKLIDSANCSIHLIGNNISGEIQESIEEDFNLAREQFKNNSDFNIFVWHPDNILEDRQSGKNELLNNIRNSIYSNMIFSTHESPMLFVEDIRTMLLTEKKADFDLKDSDVFLLYNATDYSTANEIIDLLSDISGVEDLKINPDSMTNYSDYIMQQANKSILTVIYYHKASEWALHFMQQVWKNCGGASVNGHFLLIGAKDPERPEEITFEAPKTTSKSVAPEMISLEIKVELDRLKSE